VDAVAAVRGGVLPTAELAKEKMTTTASQAKTHASDAGKGLFAVVAEGFGAMKARGLNAVEFAKENLTKARDGITTRATSVKVAVAAKISDIKFSAIKVGSRVQQRTLGYVPVGIKTGVASARGYTIDKFSAAQCVAASLVDRSRTSVLTRANSTQTMVNGMMDSGKAQAVNLGIRAQTIVVKHTPIPVKSAVATAYNSASTNASAVNAKAKEIASDPKAKTAAAGAAGGAVAMGATGGAVGMASGSVIGAVVGLVPAVFTFGLSIPLGAMLGGSAGLCVGTAVGSTTGLVAGGAAGYHKHNISSSTTKTYAQVKETAGVSRQFVVKQVASSASFVRARVHMISGTGGTEFLHGTGGTEFLPQVSSEWNTD
jgi:hypothetical protein